MMRRVNSRLASLIGVRQIEATVRADVAADAASCAVGRVWRQVLALLKDPGHWSHAQGAAHAVFAGLTPAVAGDVAARLAATARWGHRTAARALEDSLPQRVLMSAAARRTIHGGTGRRKLSTLPRPASSLEAADGRGAVRPVHPRYGAKNDSPRRDPERAALGGVSVAPLLEAAPSVASILFPAYTPEEVVHVVYASGWEARLAAGTRLASPARLANVVAAGLAAGKDHRQIARDLLPVVQGVQSTARRIARTESMRVAGATQDACAAQLGDLQVGWQIHSTLSHWSRPWHAARNGTVYYFHPKPGQKGMRQCPVPPEEAPDPAERPPGTPQTAWNCLCWRSPVLRDPGDLSTSYPAPVVPDPLVFHEFFERTDEKRRRVAVGTKRYSLVADLTGRKPQWADFLDPVTGGLLHVATLKAETPVARQERTAKVRTWLDFLRGLLRFTSAMGFLPGE